MNVLSLFNHKKKDYSVPDRDSFDQEYANTYYTPDMWNLCRRMQHNVFVCDEFMRGLPRHEVIETDVTQRAVAFTKQPYWMWKKKLGLASFPILLQPTRREEKFAEPVWVKQPARVKGTIYSVSQKTIIKLDTIKLNGVQFRRERITLTVPNRRVTVLKGREVRGNPLADAVQGFDNVRAWAYIGVRPYWEDQLDGGYSFAPVQLYSPNDGRAPFYYFSKGELSDV